MFSLKITDKKWRVIYYLLVTPDDVELHDYKWNGVFIKAQTSSKVISRGEEKV